MGVILSGCGKRDNTEILSFATWGSKTEIEIIRNIISDFETQNPDIKIDLMHIPQNYFQKIHLLFASNTEPDVIFLNNLYLPVYANAGKLLELVPDKTVYNEKVLQSLSWNGTYYAIPRDISLLVILDKISIESVSNTLFFCNEANVLLNKTNHNINYAHTK